MAELLELVFPCCFWFRFNPEAFSEVFSGLFVELFLTWLANLFAKLSGAFLS